MVLQDAWAGYHIHKRIKVYGHKHYKPFYGFNKFAPKKVVLVEEYLPPKYGFDYSFGGLGDYSHHGFSHDYAGYNGYGKVITIFKDHHLGGELDFGEF